VNFSLIGSGSTDRVTRSTNDAINSLKSIGSISARVNTASSNLSTTSRDLPLRTIPVSKLVFQLHHALPYQPSFATLQRADMAESPAVPGVGNQSAVWSNRDVVHTLMFDQHLGFQHRFKDLPIKKFISQLSIERFDVAILPGTT